MSHFRKLLGAGIVVAAFLTGGVAYAVTTQATVPTNATDVVRRTGLSITLGMPGEVKTTILSVSLPAGKWVLSATQSVINTETTVSYFRCGIYRGTTEVANAIAAVGLNTAASKASVLTEIGATTLTAPTTISVKCSHDDNLASASQNLVYQGASLLAHKAAAFG